MPAPVLLKSVTPMPPLLAASATQVTPSSADLSEVSSASMACTSTWARRMSILPITSCMARISFGGAVMISELVRSSGITETSVLPPRRRRQGRLATGLLLQVA